MICVTIKDPSELKRVVMAGLMTLGLIELKAGRKVDIKLYRHGPENLGIKIKVTDKKDAK